MYKVHLAFFTGCRRNRCQSHVSLILDIVTRSGGIRIQSMKLYKIAPNCLHVFGRHIFWGEPPNLWACTIKHLQIPIMWQSFTPMSHGAQRCLCKINEIYRYAKFQMFTLKILGGPPSSFGVCASKHWSILRTCINMRGMHPIKAEIVGSVNIHIVSGPKFTNFFTQCGRGCSWYHTFRIFSLSIRSGDTCNKSRKLWEIALNFGRFCHPKFCLGGPSKSYTQIIMPVSWNVAKKSFMRLPH